MSITPDDPYGSLQRVKSDKTGVRVFEKGRVEDGLILFHSVVGNKAVVIDLNGNVLREFKIAPPGYTLYRPIRDGSRGTIRAILTKNDNRNQRVIAEISPSGVIINKTSHRWFTHDFHQLPEGRMLCVVRENREYKGSYFSDTTILELHANGSVIWRWSPFDHIDELRHGSEIREAIVNKLTDNPFHINSIQYISWPEAYTRFEEPIVVASARNIDSVFIIGRRSGRVLYEMPDLTLGQHHARLLPEKYPGRGNIIVFDNGLSFSPFEKEPRPNSRVLEFDIEKQAIVWKYEHPKFFSPIVGAQQRFASGNTFITEGYFGRLFEVNYDGKIVWDYVYPEANDPAAHPKRLYETGLRQIYRAYKVQRDWLEGFEVL